MRTGFGCIFSSNYARTYEGDNRTDPTRVLHRKPGIKFYFELSCPGELRLSVGSEASTLTFSA